MSSGQEERLNSCGLPQYHLRRIGPPATKVGVADIMDFHSVITLIGRNVGQVDYVLDSSYHNRSLYISRVHARVVIQTSGGQSTVLRVTDRCNEHRLHDDSMNGVFINNMKIAGSVIMREGDRVTFGHPRGLQIQAGTRIRQPDSEYQFIFEKCFCPSDAPTTTDGDNKNQFAVPKTPGSSSKARHARNATRTFTKEDCQNMKKEYEERQTKAEPDSNFVKQEVKTETAGKIHTESVATQMEETSSHISHQTSNSENFSDGTQQRNQVCKNENEATAGTAFGDEVKVKVKVSPKKDTGVQTCSVSTEMTALCTSPPRDACIQTSPTSCSTEVETVPDSHVGEATVTRPEQQNLEHHKGEKLLPCDTDNGHALTEKDLSEPVESIGGMVKTSCTGSREEEVELEPNQNDHFGKENEKLSTADLVPTSELMIASRSVMETVKVLESSEPLFENDTDDSDSACDDMIERVDNCTENPTSGVIERVDNGSENTTSWMPENADVKTVPSTKHADSSEVNVADRLVEMDAIVKVVDTNKKCELPAVEVDTGSGDFNKEGTNRGCDAYEGTNRGCDVDQVKVAHEGESSKHGEEIEMEMDEEDDKILVEAVVDMSKESNGQRLENCAVGESKEHLSEQICANLVVNIEMTKDRNRTEVTHDGDKKTEFEEADSNQSDEQPSHQEVTSVAMEIEETKGLVLAEVKEDGLENSVCALVKESAEIRSVEQTVNPENKSSDCNEVKEADSSHTEDETSSQEVVPGLLFSDSIEFFEEMDQDGGSDNESNNSELLLEPKNDVSVYDRSESDADIDEDVHCQELFSGERDSVESEDSINQELCDADNANNNSGSMNAGDDLMKKTLNEDQIISVNHVADDAVTSLEMDGHNDLHVDGMVNPDQVSAAACYKQQIISEAEQCEPAIHTDLDQLETYTCENNLHKEQSKTDKPADDRQKESGRCLTVNTDIQIDDSTDRSGSVCGEPVELDQCMEVATSNDVNNSALEGTMITKHGGSIDVLEKQTMKDSISDIDGSNDQDSSDELTVRSSDEVGIDLHHQKSSDTIKIHMKLDHKPTEELRNMEDDPNKNLLANFPPSVDNSVNESKVDHLKNDYTTDPGNQQAAETDHCVKCPEVGINQNISDAGSDKQQPMDNLDNVICNIDDINVICEQKALSTSNTELVTVTDVTSAVHNHSDQDLDQSIRKQEWVVDDTCLAGKNTQEKAFSNEEHDNDESMNGGSGTDGLKNIKNSSTTPMIETEDKELSERRDLPLPEMSQTACITNREVEKVSDDPAKPVNAVEAETCGICDNQGTEIKSKNFDPVYSSPVKTSVDIVLDTLEQPELQSVDKILSVSIDSSPEQQPPEQNDGRCVANNFPHDTASLSPISINIALLKDFTKIHESSPKENIDGKLMTGSGDTTNQFVSPASKRKWDREHISEMMQCLEDSISSAGEEASDNSEIMSSGDLSMNEVPPVFVVDKMEQSKCSELLDTDLVSFVVKEKQTVVSPKYVEFIKSAENKMDTHKVQGFDPTSCKNRLTEQDLVISYDKMCEEKFYDDENNNDGTVSSQDDGDVGASKASLSDVNQDVTETLGDAATCKRQQTSTLSTELSVLSNNSETDSNGQQEKTMMALCDDVTDLNKTGSSMLSGDAVTDGNIQHETTTMALCDDVTDHNKTGSSMLSDDAVTDGNIQHETSTMALCDDVMDHNKTGSSMLLDNAVTDGNIQHETTTMALCDDVMDHNKTESSMLSDVGHEMSEIKLPDDNNDEKDKSSSSLRLDDAINDGNSQHELMKTSFSDDIDQEVTKPSILSVDEATTGDSCQPEVTSPSPPDDNKCQHDVTRTSLSDDVTDDDITESLMIADSDLNNDGNQDKSKTFTSDDIVGNKEMVFSENDTTLLDYENNEGNVDVAKPGHFKDTCTEENEKLPASVENDEGSKNFVTATVPPIFMKETCERNDLLTIRTLSDSDAQPLSKQLIKNSSEIAGERSVGQITVPSDSVLDCEKSAGIPENVDLPQSQGGIGECYVNGRTQNEPFVEKTQVLSGDEKHIVQENTVAAGPEITNGEKHSKQFRSEEPRDTEDEPAGNDAELLSLAVEENMELENVTDLCENSSKSSVHDVTEPRDTEDGQAERDAELLSLAVEVNTELENVTDLCEKSSKSSVHEGKYPSHIDDIPPKSDISELVNSSEEEIVLSDCDRKKMAVCENNADMSENIFFPKIELSNEENIFCDGCEESDVRSFKHSDDDGVYQCSDAASNNNFNISAGNQILTELKVENIGQMMEKKVEGSLVIGEVYLEDIRNFCKAELQEGDGSQEDESMLPNLNLAEAPSQHSETTKPNAQSSNRILAFDKDVAADYLQVERLLSGARSPSFEVSRVNEDVNYNGVLQSVEGDTLPVLGANESGHCQETNNDTSLYKMDHNSLHSVEASPVLQNKNDGGEKQVEPVGSSSTADVGVCNDSELVKKENAEVENTDKNSNQKLFGTNETKLQIVSVCGGEDVYQILQDGNFESDVVNQDETDGNCGASKTDIYMCDPSTVKKCVEETLDQTEEVTREQSSAQEMGHVTTPVGLHNDSNLRDKETAGISNAGSGALLRTAQDIATASESQNSEEQDMLQCKAWSGSQSSDLVYTWKEDGTKLDSESFNSSDHMTQGSSFSTDSARDFFSQNTRDSQMQIRAKRKRSDSGDEDEETRKPKKQTVDWMVHAKSFVSNFFRIRQVAMEQKHKAANDRQTFRKNLVAKLVSRFFSSRKDSVSNSDEAKVISNEENCDIKLNSVDDQEDRRSVYLDDVPKIVLKVVCDNSDADCDKTAVRVTTSCDNESASNTKHNVHSSEECETPIQHVLSENNTSSTVYGDVAKDHSVKNETNISEENGLVTSVFSDCTLGRNVDSSSALNTVVEKDMINSAECVEMDVNSAGKKELGSDDSSMTTCGNTNPTEDMKSASSTALNKPMEVGSNTAPNKDMEIDSNTSPNTDPDVGINAASIKDMDDEDDWQMRCSTDVENRCNFSTAGFKYREIVGSPIEADKHPADAGKSLGRWDVLDTNSENLPEKCHLNRNPLKCFVNRNSDKMEKNAENLYITLQKDLTGRKDATMDKKDLTTDQDDMTTKVSIVSDVNHDMQITDSDSLSILTISSQERDFTSDSEPQDMLVPLSDSDVTQKNQTTDDEFNVNVEGGIYDKSNEESYSIETDQKTSSSENGMDNSKELDSPLSNTQDSNMSENILQGYNAESSSGKKIEKDVGSKFESNDSEMFAQQADNLEPPLDGTFDKDMDDNLSLLEAYDMNSESQNGENCHPTQREFEVVRPMLADSLEGDIGESDVENCDPENSSVSDENMFKINQVAKTQITEDKDHFNSESAALSDEVLDMNMYKVTSDHVSNSNDDSDRTILQDYNTDRNVDEKSERLNFSDSGVNSDISIRTQESMTSPTKSLTSNSHSADSTEKCPFRESTHPSVSVKKKSNLEKTSFLQDNIGQIVESDSFSRNTEETDLSSVNYSLLPDLDLDNSSDDRGMLEDKETKPLLPEFDLNQEVYITESSDELPEVVFLKEDKSGNIVTMDTNIKQEVVYSESDSDSNTIAQRDNFTKLQKSARRKSRKKNFPGQTARSMSVNKPSKHSGFGLENTKSYSSSDDLSDVIFVKEDKAENRVVMDTNIKQEVVFSESDSDSNTAQRHNFLKLQQSRRKSPRTKTFPGQSTSSSSVNKTQKNSSHRLEKTHSDSRVNETHHNWVVKSECKKNTPVKTRKRRPSRKRKGVQKEKPNKKKCVYSDEEIEVYEVDSSSSEDDSQRLFKPHVLSIATESQKSKVKGSGRAPPAHDQTSKKSNDTDCTDQNLQIVGCVEDDVKSGNNCGSIQDVFDSEEFQDSSSMGDAIVHPAVVYSDKEDESDGELPKRDDDQNLIVPLCDENPHVSEADDDDGDFVPNTCEEESDSLDDAMTTVLVPLDVRDQSSQSLSPVIHAVSKPTEQTTKHADPQKQPQILFDDSDVEEEIQAPDIDWDALESDNSKSDGRGQDREDGRGQDRENGREDSRGQDREDGRGQGREDTRGQDKKDGRGQDGDDGRGQDREDGRGQDREEDEIASKRRSSPKPSCSKMASDDDDDLDLSPFLDKQNETDGVSPKNRDSDDVSSLFLSPKSNKATVSMKRKLFDEDELMSPSKRTRKIQSKLSLGFLKSPCKKKGHLDLDMEVSTQCDAVQMSDTQFEKSADQLMSDTVSDGQSSSKRKRAKDLIASLRAKRMKSKSLRVDSSPPRDTNSQSSQETPGLDGTLVQRRILPKAQAINDRIDGYISRCEKLLDSLKRVCGSREVQDIPRITQWKKDLLELEQKTDRPRTVIAVVGDTGEGKSSLMNALIDQRNALPTSGMQACTAVVVEIKSNDTTSDFEADIKFLSRKEWDDELQLLLKDLTTADGKVKKGVPDPDTEAGVAYLKVRAVYGKINNYQTLSRMTTVTRWLDQTRTIRSSDPGQFQRMIDRYIENKEKIDQSSSGGEFWPIVKMVTIRLPNCDAVSSGAVLVDLPGVRDSNAARDKIAKDYLKECTAVWVVASIHRAVNNKTAKEMLGENFRRQLLMDGQYGSVAFICTKSDFLNSSELIRNLDLKDTVEPLENEIQVLQMEKDEAIVAQNESKQEISKLRKQLKKTNTEMEETQEDLKEAQTLLQDSEEVDVDSETIETLDTLKQEIQEKEREIENLEGEIAKLEGKRDVAVRKSLEKEEEIATKRREIASICAKARNEYSMTQIKRDFKAGLREMKRKAGLTEAEDEMDDYDDYNSDDDEEDVGSSADNLRVFCVSSTEYQKMKKLLTDGPPTVFKSVEETQIPSLREYIHEMTSVRRTHCAERLIRAIGRFIFDAQGYLMDDGTSCKGTRMDAKSKIEERASQLQSRFEPVVQQLSADIQDVLSRSIEPKMREGVSLAASQASEISAKWGDKPNKENRKDGGLHWMTYRCAVRRQGVYNSKSYGPIDFNEQLSEPMFRCLSVSWDKVFSGLLWQRMELCRSQLHVTLRGFTAELCQQLQVLGVPSERLQRVAVQLTHSTADKLTEMVNYLKEMVMSRQRDISRVLVPSVQENMDNTYTNCGLECGTGMFVRMKEIMAEGVNSQKLLMFDLASRKLLMDLIALRDDIVGHVRAVCLSLCNMLQSSFEPMWEAPKNSMRLRNILSDDMDKASEEIKSLFSEANIPLPEALPSVGPSTPDRSVPPVTGNEVPSPAAFVNISTNQISPFPGQPGGVLLTSRVRNEQLTATMSSEQLQRGSVNAKGNTISVRNSRSFQVTDVMTRIKQEPGVPPQTSTVTVKQEFSVVSEQSNDSSSNIPSHLVQIPSSTSHPGRIIKPGVYRLAAPSHTVVRPGTNQGQMPTVGNLPKPVGNQRPKLVSLIRLPATGQPQTLNRAAVRTAVSTSKNIPQPLVSQSQPMQDVRVCGTGGQVSSGLMPKGTTSQFNPRFVSVVSQPEASGRGQALTSTGAGQLLTCDQRSDLPGTSFCSGSSQSSATVGSRQPGKETLAHHPASASLPTDQSKSNAAKKDLCKNIFEKLGPTVRKTVSSRNSKDVDSSQKHSGKIVSTPTESRSKDFHSSRTPSSKSNVKDPLRSLVSGDGKICRLKSPFKKTISNERIQKFIEAENLSDISSNTAVQSSVPYVPENRDNSSHLSQSQKSRMSRLSLRKNASPIHGSSPVSVKKEPADFPVRKIRQTGSGMIDLTSDSE